MSSASFDVVGMGDSLSSFFDMPTTQSLAIFVIGVVDIAMLDFIPIILSRNPVARIVLLADYYDHDEAAIALALGAKGYLNKSLSAGSFIKALELISEECSVISRWPTLAEDRSDASSLPSMPRTVREYASPLSVVAEQVAAIDLGEAASDEESAMQYGNAPPHEEDSRSVPTSRTFTAMRNLSPRERAILEFVMEGESNKQIARRLEIAEGTVKVHVKAILRKIDVRNRTQAAIWAKEDQKLVEPAPPR